MKFSEMPYERPDLEDLKKQMAALIEELKGAKSFEAAKETFMKMETLEKNIETRHSLAHIRYDIDTRDEFYGGEVKFWNSALPELQEYQQQWTKAVLESAFRPEFEKEFGSVLFLNAEISLKTFSPDIIPELQKENDLSQEYTKLIASAQIPFEGKTYTLSQLTPFKTDSDDARRLAAWKAEGEWYKEIGRAHV